MKSKSIQYKTVTRARINTYQVFFAVGDCKTQKNASYSLQNSVNIIKYLKTVFFSKAKQCKYISKFCDTTVKILLFINIARIKY